LGLTVIPVWVVGTITVETILGLSNIGTCGQNHSVDEKHYREVLKKYMIVDDEVLMMFVGWMVNISFDMEMIRSL
jgi:hypothetical protein